MANALLNPKVYANAMLALLLNNLVMGRLVDTSLSNLQPKMAGITHKRGDTIFVKRPPEFTIRSGATFNAQDVEIGEVAVVMNKQRGIDIQFTSLEQTLNVDDLVTNAIMRAEAAQLAQEIDKDLIELFKEFPSWAGTAGETIDSATDFFKAPERLDDMSVPQTDRNGVLGPRDHWALAASFTSLLTQQGIATDALTQGKLPVVGTVQPHMSQSVVNLTTGTRAGTVLVDGATQEVTYATAKDTYTQSLILKGATASTTFKLGDTFTIADVFAVNRRTKAKLDFLQQFVITADGAFDGSGDGTPTISPPIIIDGAFQTVNSSPADSAAITFVGAADTAFPMNAAFHKSAIALVFARMITPFSGTTSYATDKKSGVSIRYWRQSDITNDIHLHRWDVLYGVKMLDNRLGTRISGTS